MRSSCGNCLLRTPKVYNAVITSDENLTPSRAFPVIQPTIHETGIATTFPFGPFTPYRFYNPPIVHLEQHTIPQELLPRAEQLPIPPAPPIDKPVKSPQPESNPPEQILPDIKNQENPTPPTKEEPVAVSPEEKLPIPLNEYGLPPSLIPLHQYAHSQGPINLQPYPYNHYPLIYDTYNQFQDHYLPPYGYYPAHTFAIRPPQNNGNIPISPPQEQENQLLPEEPPKGKETPQQNNFDSIKNGTKNKNSAVPDVPPPPLPSGAKTTK